LSDFVGEGLCPLADSGRQARSALTYQFLSLPTGYPVHIRP